MAEINQVGNALTGSTGTGAFVGDDTPTLITPEIGAATGTSINLGATTTIDGFLDEDNMASDSATKGATQQSIKAYVDNSLGDTDNANILINGQFTVSQRGLTFTAATVPANNDDTYLIDRWILLSDGNDILDVSKETTVLPTGASHAIKLDIETANKKAGILQIAEYKNCKFIIGGTASLSFKAEKVVGNATVDKLRAAVISWTGSSDIVTSDVVSAWNSEGVDPTLVANWTYENTPSDLTLTDSFQTFMIENISIDTASTTNVAVFIWIDNDDGTVGDLVYISDVKLENSPVATAYPVELYETIESNCFEYSRQVSGNANPFTSAAVATSTSVYAMTINHPVNMRVAPTVSVSAVTDFTIVYTGVNTTTGLTVNGSTTNSTYLSPVTGTGTPFTAGQAGWLRTLATGSPFIFWSAEL